MAIAVRLDFPPSMNTYWRYCRGRVFLSQKGREYKKAVAANVTPGPSGLFTGRLGVQLQLSAPNRTQDIDLDNRLKPVFDALEGVLYVNDRQIDKIIVERMPISPGGYCDVIVSEL